MLGLALQIGSAIFGHAQKRKEARAYRAMQEKKAKNAMQTMMHTFQNLENARRDSFMQATAELENTRLHQRGLEGMVKAGTAEEMGDSRTARAINRSADAMSARIETSIKSNYTQQSNEIDLNKESKWLETKQFIEGLDMPKLPSAGSLFMDIGMAYLGHRQNQDAIRAYRLSKGVNDANIPYMGNLWDDRQSYYPKRIDIFSRTW